METLFPRYFAALHRVLDRCAATDVSGDGLSLSAAGECFIGLMRKVRASDAKLMFVGNGGSAGICSHMAIDYTKNGEVPSLAFNDGAALTCLGNDLGYENVFARQIAAHGRRGDVLVAISSSGRSSNILRAVEAARTRGCAAVVTMSGFSADNPLRGLGDLNFFIDSDQYGFVEIGHLALLHAMLDLAMGWKGRINGDGLDVYTATSDRA